MPQLTRKQDAGERGSVLVAVIAFAIIISIAAGGLLMLAGNTVVSETDELDDYQALLAAESGLRLGLRWLGDTLNWQATQAAGAASIGIYTINGMTDTVDAIQENGRLVLRSRAVNDRMKYIKEVACNVDASNGFGLATNSWDPGRLALHDIWFDGPVHSNAPLRMANAPAGKRGSVYFLNGPVSITDTRTGLTSRGIGPSGNNYAYGIDVDDLFRGGGQGRVLDGYFDNTFAHSMDSVKVPWPDFNGITPLPPNQSTTIRALLYFDTLRVGGMLTGRATYYYYNAANALQPLHVISPVDNVIIRARNSINVLGVVQGRVTVVTDPGFDIHPVGDVAYADFRKRNDDEIDNFNNYNPVTNYGINPAGTNFLALISGGDIRFHIGHEKEMENSATGQIRDRIVAGELRTYFYVTGALFAANPGRGILWDPGSTLANYDYDLYIIGSRTVDQYFNYTSYFGAAANTQFRFFYDRRFDTNIAAPGIPAFRRVTPGGNNLYLLKTTNWRETNLPRP